MKEFFKKKAVIVAAAAVAAALLLGVGAHFLNGRSGFLKDAAAAVMRPVGRGVAAIADFYEDIYGYMFEFDSLRVENERLRLRVSELEGELRESGDAIAENERLRALAGLREKRSDLVFESATIIEWGASSWSSEFTISKGSSSGVELLDAVVTETGCLVGHVVELGVSTARVRSVIDTGMSAGALLERTGTAGVVSGEFALMKAGRTLLSYLPVGSDVKNGDVVLTSGSGGTLPRGLVVGTVAGVETDSSGLSLRAVIEPAAELSGLSQVFVIKDFEMVE